MQIISQWENHRQLQSCTSSSPPASDVNQLQDDGSNTTSAIKTKSQSASVVSFAAEQDNVIHEVLPLSEYTPEEIRACWFTRSEYNSFKRNSLVTLSLNRAGELSPDDPEHTMRGLECRTRECTDSRRIMRYRAAAAVFDEQARQRGLGIWDPEALSECYHSISWYSMYDAHTQGMADEQDNQALLLLAEEETASTTKFLVSGPSITRRTSSKKRNTVLSKVISIETSAAAVVVVPEPAPLLSSSSSSSLITGLDCRLWSQTGIHSIATTCAASSTITTNASFNLNAFFNDMSLGIAVAAA